MKSMKYVMILLMEQELYVFISLLFMCCYDFSSRVCQIINTYVKPLHPAVIDTHDTWHCVRAIVAGVEEPPPTELYPLCGHPMVCLANSYNFSKSLEFHRLVNPAGIGTIWVHA